MLERIRRWRAYWRYFWFFGDAEIASRLADEMHPDAKTGQCSQAARNGPRNP